MDEDNSTRLAIVYRPQVRQIVGLYPYLWKHEINGDWFLYHTFRDNLK